MSYVCIGVYDYVCGWWKREIVLLCHVVLRCGCVYGCLLLLPDKLGELI